MRTPKFAAELWSYRAANVLVLGIFTLTLVSSLGGEPLDLLLDFGLTWVRMSFILGMSALTLASNLGVNP